LSELQIEQSVRDQPTPPGAPFETAMEYLVDHDVRISFADHRRRVVSVATLLREEFVIRKDDRLLGHGEPRRHRNGHGRILDGRRFVDDMRAGSRAS
jgi:hypothetical protein